MQISNLPRPTAEAVGWVGKMKIKNVKLTRECHPEGAKRLKDPVVITIIREILRLLPQNDWL